MYIRLQLFFMTVAYLFFIAPLTPPVSYADAASWETLNEYKLEDTAKAVLTIDGKLQGKELVKFDLIKLTQLPSESFNVTHPLTKEVDRYAGISLKDILSNLGISSEATYILVRASNNYKSAVRIKDINRFEYLLSYKKNNKFYDELPANQNKGPLAIVINFDKHPELDYDIYKHQLVWFVEKITVK